MTTVAIFVFTTSVAAVKNTLIYRAAMKDAAVADR